MVGPISLSPPSINWVADTLILLALAGVFFYVRAKAKNQATKEDIRTITQIVESIRSEHTVFIESIKARHMLRLAALEKRLTAHQQAYKILQRAVSKRLHPDFAKEIFNAQDWWFENCLYLESKARDAFYVATNQLHINSELIRHQDGKQNDLILKTWADVQQALQLLIEGVDLPPIKEELQLPEAMAKKSESA